MRRLNKARVALKHHGTLPSRLDVESFRASTTAFFTDNVPLIFGIDFDAISMLDLISCTTTRDRLVEAETHRKAGQHQEALDQIALSFTALVDDYEQRKRSRYGQSPFFFGSDHSIGMSFTMGLDHDQLGRFVDEVQESLQAIRSAMKILSLALDYRRYVRFNLLTPRVIRVASGNHIIQRTRRESTIHDDDVVFCRDFVIDSALRLQEFDFEVERAPRTPSTS